MSPDNAESHSKLAIIGGGAAGFFAAANLAEYCPQLQINLYEASKKFLAKVEISGGGRCNVTHKCLDIVRFSESYARGQHELRGALTRFSPLDTIQWFEDRGVMLKTESDGRMFPVTDSSQTIINCLTESLNNGCVRKYFGTGIKSIIRRANTFTIELANGESETADFVLLATGSSKSGHKMAESLGHSISSCVPSLFTFKCSDIRLNELAGLSFQDCSLILKTSPGKEFKQQGPLLITHWGLSGPAVLKLSAFAARELAAANYQASLLVNWIAGRQSRQAFEDLLPLRKTLARKEIGSNPQFSLTRRFWERILSYCKIPLSLHFFELSNQQLNQLCEVLTKSEIKIEGKGEFKEEFVTCGGVNLKEVDFKKFESKLVANLYFAGEILDIDGITGGFNFQAAWTGGWSVAQAIRQKILL